jgi:rfaE bifunctional protein nucleotidyltransferase chain/domain
MRKKYYPLKSLKIIIAEERKANKTIALANGGFDLIHIGHVRYLQAAKKTADILVVALNSDRSLQALKGRDRPIIDEKGRIQIISSFACVDYVTLFDQTRVDQVLLALKPDVHCKGSDYTEASVPERLTVLGYGGKIAIVGGAKVESTSDIIKRIKKLYTGNRD